MGDAEGVCRCSLSELTSYDQDWLELLEIVVDLRLGTRLAMRLWLRSTENLVAPVPGLAQTHRAAASVVLCPMSELK